MSITTLDWIGLGIWLGIIAVGSYLAGLEACEVVARLRARRRGDSRG